ncbi:MAG: hypothetical protein ACTHZ9_10860 [Leucobacter sp.]
MQIIAQVVGGAIASFLLFPIVGALIAGLVFNPLFDGTRSVSA